MHSVSNFIVTILIILTGDYNLPDSMTMSSESEKFVLVPSPVPIMSHREYRHIPPRFSKGTTSRGGDMAQVQSPNVLNVEMAKKTAADESLSPAGPRDPNCSNNGETVIVLESSIKKKRKSLTKRARFARCSKDVKYLCEVCSKPDCMKCSNCL